VFGGLHESVTLLVKLNVPVLVGVPVTPAVDAILVKTAG